MGDEVSFMRLIFESGQAAAASKEQGIRDLIAKGKKSNAEAKGLSDATSELGGKSTKGGGAAELTPTQALEVQFEVGQYTNMISGISNTNKALKDSVSGTLANLR